MVTGRFLAENSKQTGAMTDIPKQVGQDRWPGLAPAVIALLLIQAIFLVKYGERAVGFWPAVLGAVAVSAAFVWEPPWRIRISSNWRWLVLALWSLGLALALHRIPPTHFQVDRWDCVVYWWDALLRGEFPYSARTRFNGFPSPLPFLQLVMAPFALWGDLAWATLLAWGLWVAWIWRRAGSLALPQLVLALLAPPVLWEILGRSTLVVNSLLLMLFLWLALPPTRSQAAVGAMAGLLLSTRLAFAVPLAGWGLAEAIRGRRNLRQLIVIGICALASFGLTLSPLWLGWNIDQWRAHNPFAHHQLHMPWIGTAALLSLSLALAWRRPDRQFHNAAWVLLSFGVLFCFNAILKYGWQEAWYGHRADISYLLFAWPLLWTYPFCASLQHAPLRQSAADRLSFDSGYSARTGVDPSSPRTQ